MLPKYGIEENMIDRSKRYLKPETIFFKKNPSGTYVLANANDDDYGIMELEETAAEIWEKIVAGMTVGEIIDDMSESYEANPADIQKDVEEFINSLLEIDYLMERP